MSFKRIHAIRKCENGYFMRYDKSLFKQNLLYVTNDLNSLIEKIKDLFEGK